LILTIVFNLAVWGFAEYDPVTLRLWAAAGFSVTSAVLLLIGRQ
jgi:uncharacterized membrane protein YphA (DoxX/SURF4 family)